MTLGFTFTVAACVVLSIHALVRQRTGLFPLKKSPTHMAGPFSARVRLRSEIERQLNRILVVAPVGEDGIGCQTKPAVESIFRAEPVEFIRAGPEV